MKKRKLKGFVLPTVYVLVIGVLFISISFLGTALQHNLNYEDLAVSALSKNSVTPVIKNTEAEVNISKPFTSDKVKVSKSFYNMKDDEEKQQNSLVYYEKTYLQNSGILYSATETFDVVNSLDGTVTNVAKDEILGNYVEVTHNSNLKTVYYSLGEILVKKDDELKSGQVIGKSGDNLLDDKEKNNLLFEVYHNGFAINPEEFYNMNLEDLN